MIFRNNNIKIWNIIIIILASNYVLFIINGINLFTVFYFVITLIIVQVICIKYPKSSVNKWLKKIQNDDYEIIIKKEIEVLNNKNKLILTNSNINYIKNKLIRKIKRKIGYNEKFRDNLYICKYPKYDINLSIREYVFFNNAYIIFNISPNKSKLIYEEIISHYKLKNTQIFIINIDIKIKFTSNEIDEFKKVDFFSNEKLNNYISVLNYGIESETKKIYFYFPLIKIHLRSTLISYETMSYLKLKGEKIDNLVNIKNKSSIYSRVEGLERILFSIFKKT